MVVDTTGIALSKLLSICNSCSQSLPCHFNILSLNKILLFSDFAVSNSKNTNMRFADRVKEQEALRTALENESSNFIVVHGLKAT